MYPPTINTTSWTDANPLSKTLLDSDESPKSNAFPSVEISIYSIVLVFPERGAVGFISTKENTTS